VVVEAEEDDPGEQHRSPAEPEEERQRQHDHTDEDALHLCRPVRQEVVQVVKHQPELAVQHHEREGGGDGDDRREQARKDSG
jgi:hypothetical protein